VVTTALAQIKILELTADVMRVGVRVIVSLFVSCLLDLAVSASLHVIWGGHSLSMFTVQDRICSVLDLRALNVQASGI